MIDLRSQKILVIAPHPDDEVLGCGGFISRAKREGAKAFVLYMTVGDSSDFSRRGFSQARERIREIERVAAFLNLDGYELAFPGNDFHLRLDRLPQKELIDRIERGGKVSLEMLKPSVVLFPPLEDHNQDHRATSQAAVAACRPVPADYKHTAPVVLTYENPNFMWNTAAQIAAGTVSFELAKKDLEQKIGALALYKSQIKNRKGPYSPYAVRALASLRGIQVGKEHAETFLIRRFLV
jgi:LmbE family N-acetylglucosaminyl deacetylase